MTALVSLREAGPEGIVPGRLQEEEDVRQRDAREVLLGSRRSGQGSSSNLRLLMKTWIGCAGGHVRRRSAATASRDGW